MNEFIKAIKKDLELFEDVDRLKISLKMRIDDFEKKQEKEKEKPAFTKEQVKKMTYADRVNLKNTNPAEYEKIMKGN